MNISVMSDTRLFMRKQSRFKNHAKNGTDVQKLKQKIKKKSYTQEETK